MELIGPTPEGLKVHVYVTGGEVFGPNIQGEILPVGGDWLTIRPDGVGLLNVRATMNTEDGALIYTFYTGMTDFGENPYEKLLKGEVSQEESHVRCRPVLLTAHPDYTWLNRIFCLGIGRISADRSAIICDMYAVK
ncbi:hypothetical protein HNR65_002830 [Desulfosalsimonas propionicica]|uniref:Uncharacterized protein n=1 Tax=Desulfosalsimonas propionicica TaxID=332175 RepID=A0A7W0CB29_9BACT|nr:DUF3237 domain-containing protein [Desulfosalsimonas propionicica]MBA2882478.1 hypothetical protein [Desulfosalsimonas propionicica]